MQVAPMSNRVLVAVDKEDEVSVGGIIIPDGAREKPARGTVVSVGPGKVSEHGIYTVPSVKPGDRVLFSKYGGTEIEVNGEEHRIVSEDDILATITEG